MQMRLCQFAIIETKEQTRRKCQKNVRTRECVRKRILGSDSGRVLFTIHGSLSTATNLFRQATQRDIISSTNISTEIETSV